MAFIGKDDGIVGQIFEQGRWRLAGLPARQPARIVFDAGARPGGLDHFQVKGCALFQALGFEQFSLGAEVGQGSDQLGLYALHRLLQRRARRHIVAVGIDLDRIQRARLVAGQGIEFGDAVDRVAEQLDAPGAVFLVRRENVDRIASDPKCPAGEIVVVAPVLQRHQVLDRRLAVYTIAPRNADGGAGIGFHRTDTVDARHRRHDDHVVALQDRPRRRMAHAVDLLVHRGVLLDIGVAARDIGFGLVVVVIADEILDRVFREEGLELAVELGGQRLVRRQDQGGALGGLDDLGHGEGLARAGNAQQHLVALARVDARHQFGDRGALVARRNVIGHQLEGLAAFGLFRSRRAVGHKLADRHRRIGRVNGLFRRYGSHGQRHGIDRRLELGSVVGESFARLAAPLGNHAVIVGHGRNIVRAAAFSNP